MILSTLNNLAAKNIIHHKTREIYVEKILKLFKLNVQFSDNYACNYPTALFNNTLTDVFLIFLICLVEKKKITLLKNETIKLEIFDSVF